MNFQYIRSIPKAAEIVAEWPLPPALAEMKRLRDIEVRDIVTGRSGKFLLIVGPCSADNEDAICDYVSRLRKVQDETADRLVIVPRIYTNKPRTTGEGYKGILHQPDPEKAPDMVAGIIALRRMHLRALAESGLPAADEMLYPENHTYLEDMLAYVAVGARSVENQQHRLTASGLDIPVGMKNPTSGDLSVMLNSIQAAQGSHTFIYQGFEVRTAGNPLAHAVLRGAVDRNGTSIPNYHYEDLLRLHGLYEQRGLRNPMVVVDVNHSNSDKDPGQQPRISMEILHSRRLAPDLRTMVRGLMIESYIEGGRQQVGDHVYGKSLTDACLDWETTRRLILEIADRV
ncbi:MAG: 3-deoxy-7-phosphoheptulonate synthase [Clostridia bacterium]|nr:3-deoxy-7-phosphoheptulonate synthase [Clostridia bacterium]